jgi:hypothetical protein
MTAITVGHATATVQTAPAKSGAKSGPGLLARFWKAFVDSRMQQAQREIALHRHLLPAELQDVGMRLARSEKDLPFVR